MSQVVEHAVFVERKSCINCASTNYSELASGKYTDEPLMGFLAADPWGEDPLPYLRSAAWSLARCADCSQVFHRFILNAEWNERRFSKWMSADAIRAFGRRLGPEFQRTFSGAVHHVEHILRIERLTRRPRGSGPVCLLDFGCGFGQFLEACTHFGFEATGIDRSIGRRTEARIKILSSLDEIRGKMFHAITLFETLEHLDSPSDMLRELSRHLVHDGILVLETPDCDGVHSIKTKQDYLSVHPLEHINAFTHDTLKSITERAGFKCIDRGPAFVTANHRSAVKRIGKHLLKRDGRSTQLYFRKTTP
jgi:2-polyprenyl-3-methyl-5-hydroxy-6-metoxy-1,4-benzoquinol methylase